MRLVYILTHLTISPLLFPSSISLPLLLAKVCYAAELRGMYPESFKTIEPFTAATLTYKGHYVKLPKVYEAMARWIADNHYKIAGPHFNIYHVSPETQEAFEDMITEVCFPVEPV